MKLLVWNINQRSSGKEIHPFVSEMIENTNADIVVLTEFLSAASANGKNIKKFKDSLSEKYYTFCNEKRDKEREKANGIFIAVKKGFAEINCAPNEDLKTYYKEEDQPNFLQLDITVDGKPISIIGTRIRVDLKKSNSKFQEIRRGEYKQRHEQLLSLIDHINALESKNIIIAGDFNNAYIRGDESKFYLGKDGVRESYHYTSRGELNDLYDTYNYHIMKDDFADIGLTVFTPPGEQYSCGFNLCEGKPSNGYLKEDHIITKNLKAENARYCHSFIEDYKRDKEWERRWNRQKKKYEYVIVEGYPDHAILTADVDL